MGQRPVQAGLFPHVGEVRFSRFFRPSEVVPRELPELLAKQNGLALFEYGGRPRDRPGQ